MISNHNLKDIAVLLPTNDAVYEYQDIFNEYGVEVEINTRDNRELDFRTSKPKLMTYHSAKGLQFDTVFMPNVDQLRNYQKVSTYVAMTRSSKNLYLFSMSGNPNILSRAPSSLFNKTTSDSDIDFDF